MMTQRLHVFLLLTLHWAEFDPIAAYCQEMLVVCSISTCVEQGENSFGGRVAVQHRTLLAVADAFAN